MVAGRRNRLGKTRLEWNRSLSSSRVDKRTACSCNGPHPTPFEERDILSPVVAGVMINLPGPECHFGRGTTCPSRTWIPLSSGRSTRLISSTTPTLNRLGNMDILSFTTLVWEAFLQRIFQLPKRFENIMEMIDDDDFIAQYEDGGDCIIRPDTPAEIRQALREIEERWKFKWWYLHHGSRGESDKRRLLTSGSFTKEVEVTCTL